MTPVGAVAQPTAVIGREDLVRRVRELLSPGGEAVPPVVVITGSSGVGKSTLAMTTAQTMADRFRDGQLYARLDRVAEGLAGSNEVLVGFVNALSPRAEGGSGRGQTAATPARAQPASPEHVRQRFHDLTQRRRVLVILDAATDVQQVRNLLPRGRGCAVIVTAQDGTGLCPSWPTVRVDPLPENAGLAVLDALVGGGRVKAEPLAARQLVRAAAGSPMALQLVGAALSARRSWTLKVAVGHMREVRPAPAQTALPEFSAALDLACALLTDQERRSLLLLGLVAEPTFAPWEVAALLRGADGTPPTADQTGDGERAAVEFAAAERLLDRLTSAHLISRKVDDATGVATYRLAEPIEEYVRGRLVVEVHEVDRGRAVESLRQARDADAQPAVRMRQYVYRLLDDGKLSAARGVALQLIGLAQHSVVVATPDKRAGAEAEVGAALTALALVNVELGWLEEASDGAAAALKTASAPSRPGALRCLGTVQARRGHLVEAEQTLVEANQAAQQTGDAPERVSILSELAVVLARRGEPVKAEATVDEAVDLARSAGPSAARRLPGALRAKGVVLRSRNDLAGAAEALREAESQCTSPDAGLSLWRSWIQLTMASVALEQGEHGHSLELAMQASYGFRDMFHRYAIAHCRMAVGRAYRAEGDSARAARVLRDTVGTFEGCGDRWIEAVSRTWLAEALVSRRQYADAAQEFVRAAQQFDDLGDAWSAADTRRRRSAAFRGRPARPARRVPWREVVVVAVALGLLGLFGR